MTDTSSVSSNANNFVSAVENGVDSRTGLYKISINLPEIKTNDLRGPGFDLRLYYSALNPRDSGWGHGWNLKLSQYIPSTQILSLSTGETFKVTGTDSQTGQLVMKEQKIDSFHFYPEGSNRYRVVHKSGLVEILEVLGSAQNRVALPVEIHSFTGHKITLGYVPFSGSDQILSWIKDDSGQTLLTVKRDSASVEVLLYPFSGPNGGPLANFVMTLQGSDRYVSKITLPTDNQASWRFGYTLKNDHLCITSVETPSGAREEIRYQDLGHQFPTGSGRTPLPRVTDHRIFPGSGQPMVQVGYTYPGDRNFVGGGLSIPWDNGGLDNLYKYIGNYEYKCVETLLVANQPVRTIERKFNQFHLLTEEITTQNNNVQTVQTDYYLTPNVPFEQQPRYCQLPKEVKTTWSQLNNATRQRSETVSSTYDIHGNLLTHKQANGVVETSTWYPAADADDFVRYIKDRTVTPAPSAHGNAPTLRTHYTYKTLAPLTGSPLPHWHTLESETLVQVAAGIETELQRTVYTHFDDPDDAFGHGRVKRQAVTLNNKSSFVDYQYLKSISPQRQVPVQETIETLSTDFDNVSKSITRQHSLLTSQELLSRIDGEETQFHYDSLGRLTSEVASPGTQYEARRQYEYTLSAATGQPVEHVIINARNVRTRTVLDGLAREVFSERDHVDSGNPSRTRQTSAARYNERGDLVEQTVYDWLNGQELALITCFEYDDWAQRCMAIGADGVEEHQDIDPIGSDDWKGPVVRSWRQSPGPAPLVSGQTETWLNEFGKPSQTRLLDAAGNELSRETFKYDGLGRCTEQSDPNKRITRFTYDAFSRMVDSTLPDNSIVKREYAAHSTSELAVTLRVSADGVNYTLMGEQDFDGLERLTRLTTGQRTERYAYDGGQSQVSSKTTPANQTITYDYNRTLTDQPIASHAPDEIARFAFDNTSARLTRASNEQGTREYDYNTSNQLLGERWVDKQGKAWDTLYSNSMQGRLLKRTDLKQQGNNGLDTVHHYDAFGRVERTDQGQLQVHFEYDRLGQLAKTTTRDLNANSNLKTELKYDDQGREILRTLTLDQHPPRTQEQTWRVDGLLESRHLKQSNVSLLMERFDYDFRGRLTHHECSGSTLPRNDEGRPFKEQIFSFDELDNPKLTLTNFADGTSERIRFFYSTNDPCLLDRITYTPKRVTDDPTFTYDPNGNQLNDERGRRLSYDSQNRLLKVETAAGQIVSQYGYDGHDHLVNSQQGNQSEILRFYQGQQLNALVQDDRQTHLLYHQEQPLGQQQDGDDTQTLLLLTDANHSVLGESQQKTLRTAVYSAYGERHSDDVLQSLAGYNGEFRDPASSWYLLGQGYRAYNPSLMRFHSPDSHSPFDSGGLNPYCYCLGNPIALRDPSGHEAIGWSGRLRFPYEDEVPQLSGGSGGDWLSWVFVVLGAVGTVAAGAATVASFGAAAPLTGAAFGFAVAKTASLATATALSAGSTAASAVAAANGDEEAGQWGMYLGLASIVPGVAGAAFGSIARVVGNGLDDILINLAKNTDTSGTKMWGFSSDEVHKLGLRPISSAGPRLAASSNTPKFHPSLPGRNPVNANVKLPGTTAVNGTSGHPPINTEELSTQISKLKVPKPTAPPIRAETDQMKLIIEQKNLGKTIKEAAAHANQKSNRSDIVNSHLGMGLRR